MTQKGYNKIQGLNWENEDEKVNFDLPVEDHMVHYLQLRILVKPYRCLSQKCSYQPYPAANTHHTDHISKREHAEYWNMQDHEESG